MLTNQITTMVAVLGLSQVLRRFDLTTPEAVFYIRIMYFTSQVLQLLAWFYIRHLIQKKGKKDEGTTMIEVEEPAKPFSTEAKKKTRMSIRDYDLAEVKKNINQIISGAAIMIGLHFWFKFTQPMVFQSLLPWKNFFSMPIVQIRLFGWKAEGSRARPWKAPNPFGDLLNQMNDDSAAAAKKDDDLKIEPEVKSTVTEIKPISAKFMETVYSSSSDSEVEVAVEAVDADEVNEEAEVSSQDSSKVSAVEEVTTVKATDAGWTTTKSRKPRKED